MAGLVNDATGAVTPPPTAYTTPVYAGTANATAGQATSSNATGVGYKGAQTTAQQMTAANNGVASTAGLTTNTVQAPETVASQLKGLVDDNSPLLQQARATALANMNSRGLLNSSMAETGAQSAVLSQALPIAQQDASTYLTTAQANQAATNQNAEYNATNAQGMTLANLNNTQDASKTNATLGTQVNLSNQGSTNAGAAATAAAANAASSQNAQQATQTSQFNAGQNTAVSQGNAAAANQTAQFNSNLNNSAQQFNAGQANQGAIAAMNAEVSTYTAGLDSATKVQLQAMDGQNKVQLANIQAQYQQQLQSSQSAQSIYSSVVGNITSIMTNADMDPGAKQAAVNQQVQMLKDGMAVAGSVASVNLGSLLTFSGAQPAAAPAAAAAVNPNQAKLDAFYGMGTHDQPSGG